MKAKFIMVMAMLLVSSLSFAADDTSWSSLDASQQAVLAEFAADWTKCRRSDGNVCCAVPVIGRGCRHSGAGRHELVFQVGVSCPTNEETLFEIDMRSTETCLPRNSGEFGITIANSCAWTANGGNACVTAIGK